MGMYLQTCDLEAVDRAVLEDGCFVLQQALDKSFLQNLHAKTVEFFEMVQGGASDEEISDTIGMPTERVRAHLTGPRRRGVVHHIIISQRIFRDSKALSMNLAKQLAEPKVLKVIEHILGPDVFLHTNNLAVRIRKKSTPELNLPFHQDSFYWQEPDLFSTAKPIMLVLWTPFIEVNENAPGIELIKRPFRKEFKLTNSPVTQFGHLEVGDEDLESQYSNDIWYPHMNAGDLCVFGERILHRSHAMAQINTPRTSIDLRVLSQRATPKLLSGHVGIDLRTMQEITLD